MQFWTWLLSTMFNWRLQNVLYSAARIILRKQRLGLDHWHSRPPALAASSTEDRLQDVGARIQVSTSVSTHLPLQVMHPGCSSRQTESFTFSSARQPRRLVLYDKAIWTKKFCLFRADSMELTSADSDPSLSLTQFCAPLKSVMFFMFCRGQWCIPIAPPWKSRLM